MFRYRLFLVALVFSLLWLVACAPAGGEPTAAVQNTPTTAALSTVPPATPQGDVVSPSDPLPESLVLDLVLAGTAPVAIDANSQLTVISVSDSRCPKGVDCITAGSVVAEINWSDNNGNEETFKVGLQDPAVLDTAALSNGYMVTIVDAMPYPEASAPIALADYLLYVAVDMANASPVVDGAKPTAEASTIAGMLYVDSVAMALTEAVPQQATAEISGSFADGCTSLGEVKVDRVDNLFTITLNAVRPADRMCTQALVPFTHSVALDVAGLKAGDYKVMVADKETTFNLAQDNGPAEGDDSSMNGNIVDGVLYVDGVTIAIMESMPLQAAAEISGNFADGCTSLGDVVVTRLDNTFYITLKAVRPADQMCTQALVPFTQTVSLNIYGLKAGDYKVMVGESETTFNLASDNGPVAGETAMPYDAPIMAFEIVVEKSEPTKVTLKIETAYIPACETFVLTTEEVGSEIKLKAQIHLPAGMACRAPTKQMTEMIPLDVSSLTAGNYTVTINGQSNSFELP